MMSAQAEEARRALLMETAQTVGRRWFAAWRRDLAQEGRVIEGGWPGTLPEARALAAASVKTTLAEHHMPTVTNEELGIVQRATYEEAKRAWNTSTERRPDLGIESEED